MIVRRDLLHVSASRVIEPLHHILRCRPLHGCEFSTESFSREMIAFR